MTRVRTATKADMDQVAAIYEHYVRHSTATFELDPPTVAQMDQRRATVVAAGLPFLIAELEQEVIGYAYAGPYRPRAAYRFTVENSIYIHPDAVGRGVGRLLLSEILAAATRAGARQMIAIIGGSANVASVRLHTAAGFRHVGVLRSVGWKFDNWHDTVLMQRELHS